MTERNEFRICRCGHSEENHHWKKTSHYDGPDAIDAIFAPIVPPSEKRLFCRKCNCEKFNPPTGHKAKWFGLGIGIFVLFAIIYRLFISG
jgi:hypothetical protein